MKKIFKYMLMLLPLLGGCESNDPSVDISDVAWVTSGWKMADDWVYEIDEGDYLYFMNASQGLVSNAWEISSDCYFFVDDFDEDVDLDSQIDESKGLVSNNIVETVYFPTGGTHYVKLISTFNEWVTSHDDSPTEAVYDEASGLWVYEHTFSVIVKEALSMGYQVINLGSNGTYDKSDEVIFERVAGKGNTSEEEITISDGDWLRFINTSTGDDLVEAVTWVVDGVTYLGWVGDLDYQFHYDENSETDNVHTDFSLMIERTERPATDITADIQMILTVQPTALKADFSITTEDGSAVSNNTELYRGDKIYFNDLSTGTNYTSTWTYKLDGGVATEFTPDSDGEYVLSSSGTYSDFTLKIENGELYSASSSTSSNVSFTALVPDFGVSSASLDISTTATHANTETPTLVVVMNNDLATLPTFSSDNGGFTLSVTDYAGDSQTVEITDVEIDPSSSNKLLLTLGGKIYELDEVSLNYTPLTETITDVDGGALVSFSAKSITIGSVDTNILKGNANESDFSFDTGTTAGLNNWGISGWVTGISSTTDESQTSGDRRYLTHTQDSENAYDGTNYLAFNTWYYRFGALNTTNDARTSFYYRRVSADYYVNVPEGNYIIRHYVNVRTATTDTVPTYKIQCGTTYSSQSDHKALDDTTSATPYSFPSTTNEWIAQDMVVSYTATQDLYYQFKFDFDASDNMFPECFEFWIDKMEIIPIR